MNYPLIGSMIFLVATFISWLIIKLQYADKSKQVKWALFVLFFWLLNFMQLIVLAIFYQLTR